MKATCGQTVRAEIRNRMSPPNRESVDQIAFDSGITTQTLQLAQSVAENGPAGAGY
jgi:hypothetical protein